MGRSTKSWIIIFCAFTIMFISRATLIIYDDNNYQYRNSDEIKYISYAKNLIHKGQFVNDNGLRAWAPPGYPAALSLSFILFGENNIVMARLQQLLFDSITFWLVYLLGCIVGGTACGVLSSIGFVIHPENVFLLGRSMLLTENLYTMLFILFFVLLVYRLKMKEGNKDIITILIGTVSGISVLVRPILIGFPFIIVTTWLLTIAYGKNILKLKDIIIIILVFSIFPTIWMARNYFVLGGHAVLTSHSGLILFSATNPDIDGSYTEGKKIAKQVIGLTPETEGKYNQKLTELGKGNIIHYKERWLILAFKNMSRLWVNLPDKKLTTTRWLYIIYIPLFIFLLYLAGIGLLRNKSTKEGFFIIFFVIILFIYYSLLHSVSNASIRYSVPFLPIIIVYAITGILAKYSFKNCKLIQKRY